MTERKNLRKIQKLVGVYTMFTMTPRGWFVLAIYKASERRGESEEDGQVDIISSKLLGINLSSF